MPTIPLTPGSTTARVDLRLSVLGEMQLHRALLGRVRLTSDFTPVFRQIRDDYHDMEEAAFAKEGGYEGNPAWKPLSAKYAAWKAKHFPGAKILYRTGALFQALTGGSGSVEEIKPFFLRLGGSVRVGSYDLGGLHYTGTTRGMPARKPLLLSKTRKRRWLRFLTDHLRQEGKD